MMKTLVFALFLAGAAGSAAAQEGAPDSSFIVAVLADEEIANLIPITFDEIMELVEYGADVSLSVNDMAIDSAWYPRVVLFVIDIPSLRHVPPWCIRGMRHVNRVPVFVLSGELLLLRAPPLEAILPHQLRGEMETVELRLTHRGRWYDGVQTRVVHLK
ncbi:MAG: hypothetical protein Q7S84_00835 [bacterium]|nr:hypothetical protein [bacterium]